MTRSKWEKAQRTVGTVPGGRGGIQWAAPDRIPQRASLGDLQPDEQQTPQEDRIRADSWGSTGWTEEMQLPLPGQGWPAPQVQGDTPQDPIR